MNLSGSTVLVTGATGSFGRLFVRRLLADHGVAAVRALSRDEQKQLDLARAVNDDRLRLLLGDVRDVDRLRLAMRGVDLVVHAAALKVVPALEYNPFEAVQTNVVGTQNVITAAIEAGVNTVIGLSTDKAVAPTNLYGATKLLAERLLAQAGVYADGTRFLAVRYGNVVDSRGSVAPLFRAQARTGVLTITDARMTRFWLTLSEAVAFVMSTLATGRDGETHVPRIPSVRIVDLAQAIAPDAEIVYAGIRPGEKLHEVLLTEDEARSAFDADPGDRFVIAPHRHQPREPRGRPLPDGFRYSSDTNPYRLSVDDLRAMESRKERVPA